MKKISLIAIALCFTFSVSAQKRKHSEKFEQLEYELPDPNIYRNAAGAPGPEYWQNTADYKMEIKLDDSKQTISGHEVITYTNNSPDILNYLWLQLDQNVRAKDSDSYKTQTNQMRERMNAYSMRNILEKEFDGGFKISAVKDTEGNPLNFTINRTMMVIDIPTALSTGDQFSFEIDWSYNINNRFEDGGRSGYEYFPKDGNYVYTIAQFYPRMCVYNDVDGWQNKQFLGSGEFTLPFGKFEASITVPADHVLGATGLLINREEVLTEEQLARYNEAKASDEPVMIVNQEEAEAAEKGSSEDVKTWIFEADSVRDFAFATSRKFIWDAQGVNIAGRTVMAESLYPKEGNPLWEDYSTRIVAHTLRTYSKYTFDYPYHKAISVHADRIGMEYPMICFNFGRPNEDGTYPDYIKWGMLGVIIHEVGHNFFPMIVNSDERQWTWMDEGLNTFLETLTELEWDPNFPATPSKPKNITTYMKLDQESLSPIMTNSEQVQRLGPNAYTKPATALWILRETILGRELFDRAFKEYSQRWMFKHPTPADFFRTMEDASGTDLDWFWRGWFYGVEPVDISIEKVTQYKLGDPDENVKAEEMSTEPTPVEPAVVEGGKKKKKKKGQAPTAIPTPAPAETEMVMEDPFSPTNFEMRVPPSMEDKVNEKMNFYQVNLKNVGGLVMPVILEFTFDDGSKEVMRIPVEVWRKNDGEISKVFPFEKGVSQVRLDPYQETADIDEENNVWPRKEVQSRWKKFKESQQAQ